MNFHSMYNYEHTTLTAITRIPLWVKGLVAIGLLLSLMQAFNLKSSLADAIKKNKAYTEYTSGNYVTAIKSYTELLSRHPYDYDLIKSLGFSYYYSGQYYKSLKLFKQLNRMEVIKSDIDKINIMISDMTTKLGISLEGGPS